MKKFIALVVCCCCAAVFAGDKEVKDIINKTQLGAKAPRGWTLYKLNKNVGTGVIVQGTEKDEKALKISAPNGVTYFFSLASHKVKAGDKVKISADVRGKGTFYVGCYSYDQKDKYLSVPGLMKSFTLLGVEREIEIEFVVANGKKGEITEAVRPVIGAGKGSELLIEDLEIEIDYKDR